MFYISTSFNKQITIILNIIAYDVLVGRFFNIIDVVKGKMPGGLLDVFREELHAVKREAS